MNKVLGLLLAGVLFAGGMLAPESWRQAVQHQVDRLTGKSAPAPAAPAPADPPKALPFAAVQRPLALAKGQELGLGLGLFTSEAGGAGRAQRVAALGYRTQFVPLQDENGALWYLLVVGGFDSDAAAERQRAVLGDELADEPGLGGQPEIVLIPPPPKK